MPDFRRGTAAIEESKEVAQSGGNFQPFAPVIQWRENKEEKYILFINRANEIPTVLLHEFVPVGTGEKADGTEYTKYESFLSRKDASIGEEYDDLTDRLEWDTTRDRTLGVAVELEPVFETVKGRKRPKGFAVKTTNFERRIRDEDDELTDERETVTAPVVGLIAQSPTNFYSWVGSFDENEAPIEETPLKVQRDGKSTDTKYHFTSYIDNPVDLSELISNLEGVSYLGEDKEDFIEQVSGADIEDFEAALLIGTRILETRLEELADEKRYKRLVGPLKELESKFGKKKGKNKRGSKERQSQRQRGRKSEEAAEKAGDEKGDKFDRLKQTVEGDDE